MAGKKRIFKNVDEKKIKRHYVRQKLKKEEPLPNQIQENDKQRFKFGENREAVIVISIFILIFIFSLVYLVTTSSSSTLKNRTPQVNNGKALNEIILNTKSSSASAPTNSNPVSDLPQSIKVSPVTQKITPFYYDNVPFRLYFPRRDLFYLNFDHPLTGNVWTVDRQGGGIVTGPVGNAFFVEPSSSLTVKNAGDIAEYGTLNFWLRLGPEGFDKEVPIMDWNFDGKNLTPYLFEISYKNSKLIFSIYDKNGIRSEIDVLLSNWSDWHHVQFAWDFRKQPSNLEVFVDQKKLAQGSFNFVPKTFINPVFEIGGGAGNREVIPFSISRIALTNWVKDDAEMATEK